MVHLAEQIRRSSPFFIFISIVSGENWQPFESSFKWKSGQQETSSSELSATLFHSCVSIFILNLWAALLGCQVDSGFSDNTALREHGHYVLFVSTWVMIIFFIPHVDLWSFLSNYVNVAFPTELSPFSLSFHVGPFFEITCFCSTE